MKRLFLKVFGLLFGGFLLVTLLGVGLMAWINAELHPDESLLTKRAHQAASELVEAHLAGTYHEARRKLMRRKHVRAWLLDSKNVPIVGTAVPPPVMARITRYPTLDIPRRVGRHQEIIYATEVARQDTVYRVVLATDIRAFREANRGRFVGASVFAMLVAFGVASLLLTLWILRPLRSIRTTASSITADDLSARVPEAVTSRRDAFGALGSEFNQMTNRLQRSVEAQRQLLRDISHELRTPLARIQVAASLSAQRSGDNQDATRIEAEVARLDEMIESLLTLSRLQDGADLLRQQFDPGSLLLEIADDARFEFQNENKTIDVQLHHQSEVAGHPDMIGRAIENILRNALRFTPPDSTVQIVTRQESGALEITITDQGPGVPEDKLERIFNPFYQVDRARSPDARSGHGVGLAIARSIIQLHGGSIRAQNADRGGLVQTVTLPAI